MLYIVACHGGGVSSKTRRRGADKTRSLNTLVLLERWTIPTSTGASNLLSNPTWHT